VIENKEADFAVLVLESAKTPGKRKRSEFQTGGRGTPPGNLQEYQSKGVVGGAVCKSVRAKELRRRVFD
jgi:hypothetical protein